MNKHIYQLLFAISATILFVMVANLLGLKISNGNEAAGAVAKWIGDRLVPPNSTAPPVSETRVPKTMTSLPGMDSGGPTVASGSLAPGEGQPGSEKSLQNEEQAPAKDLDENDIASEGKCVPRVISVNNQAPDESKSYVYDRILGGGTKECLNSARSIIMDIELCGGKRATFSEFEIYAYSISPGYSVYDPNGGWTTSNSTPDEILGGPVVVRNSLSGTKVSIDLPIAPPGYPGVLLCKIDMYDLKPAD